MFEKDDVTAVALSGGKDSMVSLTILNSLSEKAPKSKLFTITIDTGKPREQAAINYSKKLGVDSHVYKSKEVTLQLLKEKAKKLGATKLVIGDNLDDIGMRGFLKFISGNSIDQDDLVILPLKDTPANEVLLYNKLKKIPFKEVKREGEMATIEKLLIDVGKVYPGSNYQLAKAVEDLKKI